MNKFMLLSMAACAAFAACTKTTDTKKEKEPDPEPQPAAHRLLENFEDKGLLKWTGANGCVFEIVENPAKGGINTSEYVGKYTTAEAQWDFVWSTAFGVVEEADSPKFLDFTNDGYIIKVQCYSPAAGIPVYLKIEGVGVEACELTDVKTTKAGEWEELVFDYEPKALVDGAYKNFVICADAGGIEPGKVIYFDNIRQVLE